MASNRPDAENMTAAQILAANQAAVAAATGQVEAQQAAARAPLSQAASQAAALAKQVAVGTLRYVGAGRVWVREAELGTVLSKDVPTKTCTVTLQTDAVVAPVTPLHVSYGSGNPVVGKSYPVFVPYTLSREPTIERGPVPDPSHLPWLLAPGGTRWLYRQVNGPPLQRWAWPPPGVGEDWPPETVNDGSVGWLLGGMTDAGQSTSIVTVDFEPSAEKIRGSVNLSHPAGVPLLLKDHCYEYPGMGFESQGRDWRIDPTSVRVGAIANEGTAMVGSDTTDSFLMLPPSIGHNSELVLDAVDECCADNPFFPPIPPPRGCAQNLRYKWVESTFEFVPLRYVGFNDAVNIYAGAFGSMGLRQAVHNTYTVQHMIDPTPDPITILNSYVGGGCHWASSGPIPTVVVFDSTELRIDTFPRTGGESYTQNLAGRFNGFGYEGRQLAFPFGAWGGGAGIVAAIYHDQGIKAAPFPAVSGTNILDDHDVRIWLSVNGIPHDLTIDPTEDHVLIQPTLLAYDYDASTPIVFAIVVNLDADTDSLQKWRGGWQVITGAAGVVAVSRDGKDILGQTRAGQQVYSLDGGDTWANCAQFPASTPTDLGFKFVDQIA